MLDTNICIYLIKKTPKNVLKKLQECFLEGLSISSVTLAELEHGVYASQAVNKNMLALHQFLALVDILDFDDNSAVESGKIMADLQRKGTPIGPLDNLIAGHARATNQVLVTNNVKEFERVEGLTVENWVA
jgi:tRNA(fMet)-specific endonuclease VapC